jgi:hypothetical protein
MKIMLHEGEGMEPLAIQLCILNSFLSLVVRSASNILGFDICEIPSLSV